MSININEISAVIKKQIKNYEKTVSVSEEGQVLTVGDGIAVVDGLNSAMLNELVIFPSGVYGMVLNLEENVCGIVLMGGESSVSEGDIVIRTRKVIEAPVGDSLIGRVLDALGQPIDNKGELKFTKTRPIERVAPGVMTRESVSEPIETGIMTIDAIVPIGKGQRELIIGDRQTGKTAIAIDAIINQKGKNVICVYVAIGQKASTVAQIVNTLTTHNAMDYTTIVSASAADLAPLKYIAPYTATAIAEEWMELGKDVLIVYDDLSKHAVAYRTLSLLLRRPPGREAFPGDVFYLHSRLLERSAKLNKKYGGGSITALPIIETQAGDISAYIPTNVISITDGQIFLKTDLFNSGVRPAIDAGLSVSRVGSAAQVKSMKQVSGSLKVDLASYSELEAFSQFSSDLDDSTKRILEHGKRVVESLKQNQYEPIDQLDQTIILLSIKSKLIKWLPIDQIGLFKKTLISHFNDNATNLRRNLFNSKALSETLITNLTIEIKKIIKEITSNIQDYNPELYGKPSDYEKL